MKVMFDNKESNYVYNTDEVLEEYKDVVDKGSRKGFYDNFEFIDKILYKTKNEK